MTAVGRKAGQGQKKVPETKAHSMTAVAKTDHVKIAAAKMDHWTILAAKMDHSMTAAAKRGHWKILAAKIDRSMTVVETSADQAQKRVPEMKARLMKAVAKKLAAKNVLLKTPATKRQVVLGTIQASRFQRVLKIQRALKIRLVLKTRGVLTMVVPASKTP